MDIKKISVTELKAIAYDEGVKLEQARQNLQIINNEIIERIKKADTPKKEAGVEEKPTKEKK